MKLGNFWYEFILDFFVTHTHTVASTNKEKIFKTLFFPMMNSKKEIPDLKSKETIPNFSSPPRFSSIKRSIFLELDFHNKIWELKASSLQTCEQ